MKQSLKMLVLGCMTIGALAGCDWGKPSGTSQESSGHSSISTSTLPTSSDVSSTSTTQSSLPSSSTTSNSSASTSSSTTSVPTSSSTTSSSTSVAPVVTGITLNTDNVKKEYFDGDKLDLTGLVVTAQYSNDTAVNVTDYTTYCWCS